MILDASSVPSGEVINADLCIVGAGPAGLILGSRFVGTRHRVFILESGRMRVDSRARDLADGDIVGYPYFPLLEASGHALGGSSHLWDEWMRARPLDRADFSYRPWVDGSGWPFGRDELERYYKRANTLLGLDPYDYGVAKPLSGKTDSGLELATFKFSNTVDFERIKKRIDSSSNVGLVLGASVLELEPSPDGSRVETVVVSTDNPQRFYVSSRVYVLAAGGFGNPRLLLLSRKRFTSGLANSSRLVGSYFMEHPTVRRGVVVPYETGVTDVWDFFRFSSTAHGAYRGTLVPSEAEMKKSAILNGMVLLTETDDIRSSEALRSMAIVRDGLRRENTSGESSFAHALSVLRRPREIWRLENARRVDRSSHRRLQLSITVEQAPSAASRVLLSDRPDRFGLPRAALEWRVGATERRTVRVLQERVDQLMREKGLGHVDGLLGDEWPKRTLRGEWHQLGTTRMSSSPREGVVDASGKTHDLDNLYIAGGSVFPTVGYANPTLTIVALCLRLAEALERPLSRTVSLGPIW